MPRELYPSEARKVQEMLKQSFTDLEISRALHIAKSTVTRLRNEFTGDTEQSLEPQLENIENVDQSDTQPEIIDQELDDQQEIKEDDQDQDTDLEDKSVEHKPEKKKIKEEEDSESESLEYIEITKCPNCGNPKNNCLTIDQALDQGYKINEEVQYFYDHLCPKCDEVFVDKRPKVFGICPKCGSTSRDWATIEEAPVNDEIKKYYDLFCLNCFEPGGLLGFGKHVQCFKVT